MKYILFLILSIVSFSGVYADDADVHKIVSTTDGTNRLVVHVSGATVGTLYGSESEVADIYTLALRASIAANTQRRFGEFSIID